MKCQATKPDGTPCGAKSLRNGPYCFRHDPESKERSLVASSKGGLNRRLQGGYGEPQKLESPQDVKDFLGIVINSVWTGKIPVPVGTSMGFLTRCWLDAYETANLEKRISDIEGILNKT